MRARQEDTRHPRQGATQNCSQVQTGVQGRTGDDIAKRWSVLYVGVRTGATSGAHVAR